MCTASIAKLNTGLITALLLRKEDFSTSSQQVIIMQWTNNHPMTRICALLQKKPSSTCGPTKPPKGEKIIYHYFNLAVIIAQFYTDSVSGWTQKRIEEVLRQRP